MRQGLSSEVVQAGWSAPLFCNLGCERLLQKPPGAGTSPIKES
jgi:hypothetical protein